MWQTRLGKKTISAFSSQEFHVLKREIFAQGQYYLDLENNQPKIADIGAHIGLATLYFKDLFPAAQIEAYEPNPSARQLLEENLSQNFVEGVTVHPQAVSRAAGTIQLQIDTSPDQWWSTASVLPGGWTGTQNTQSLEVPAVALTEILQTRWDVIKMDIEGREQSLLAHLTQDQLRQVQHWLVEFHPVAGQNLDQFLDLFTKAGFEVEIRKNGRPVWITKATGLVVIHASQNVLKN